PHSPVSFSFHYPSVQGEKEETGPVESYTNTHTHTHIHTATQQQTSTYTHIHTERKTARERDEESVCVCACVCVWERDRVSMCVGESGRIREFESECVSLGSFCRRVLSKSRQ